ncbi:hypothetical protein GH714_012472 [Hevea brasiliensis]|uniref:DDE Tnp4 domain-containing protein n=1 Tax=Hevea brasiliensis TaxID=3981 RepID=A0A6A6LR59_HEVBR|nr:hypothetical protein GH714_012472 [Hevea brasiliensis]
MNVEEYVDGEGDENKWEKRIGEEENVGVYNLENDTYVNIEFETALRTEDTFFKDFLEHTSSNAKGSTQVTNQGSLAHDIIRSKDPDFKDIPTQIANDERYMPLFKQDCIGCIDGTHVATCILELDQLPYRGSKGYLSFNVMAVCDFDMCFAFVSSRWEGSTHNTRVFLRAIETSEMKFPKPPKGRYYLVDKGYPNREGYLVPYSTLRYHQSQFQHKRPQNA